MNRIKRLTLLVASLVLLCPVALGRDATSLRNQVAALTAKYRDEKKVMAMECNDGLKLKTVKVMLRASLGEEFTKCIEAVTIIFYDGASAECVSNISADIARITQNLEKDDLGNHLKDGTKGACYAKPTEDGKGVSDIVIIMEEPNRAFVYINGNFQAPNK